MGVLSALPFVSALNACCCLWVVSGGLVAAYLLQQNRTTPLTAADGAVVGLLAGVIGVAISTLLSIPIDLVLGPLQRELSQRLIDWLQDIWPETRQAFAGFEDQNQIGVAGQVALRAVAFLIFLVVGSIFSTLGGLLGAVIFSKRVTPAVSDGPMS
jgi:hypothetical protein